MAAESIQGNRGEGTVKSVEMESASCPGFVRYVSEDGRFCSCEAATFGAPDCSHRRKRRKQIRKAHRRCAGCGATSHEKALIKPKRLRYQEAKVYAGPMHCLSCSPRFDGGELDFVGRLTSDRFGGAA